MPGDNYYQGSDQPPYSNYHHGYIPAYSGSYSSAYRDGQRHPSSYRSSVWHPLPSYTPSGYSSYPAGPDHHYQRRAFHSQNSCHRQTPSGRATDIDYREAGDFSRGVRLPSSSSGESPMKPRAPPKPSAMSNRPGSIPYRKHDNRSVTPPPPQKPSSSYMAVACEDPCHLSPDDSLGSRKLLILDLNGTLLHRSLQPAGPRNKFRHTPSDTPLVDSTTVDEKTDAPSVHSFDRPLPRLRVVHPRPYMAAFRSYLFAPETKSWLDVMIWSSAQPHSVNDMVSKTFGEDQDELAVIWARDTLGLTEEHYARKVQTFKDLAKPWAELPAIFRSRTAHGSEPSSIQSTPRSSPQPSWPPSSAPPVPSSPQVEDLSQPHSARTTLLLDDSPRKAELQPYNHVCIPEYSGVRRALDLQAFQNETAALQAVKDGNFEKTAEDTPINIEPVLKEGDDGDGGDSAGASLDPDKKKRKRKDKKVKRTAALAASIAEYQARREDPYDHVLLAVIGVLEEVKSQGNVAAWIRSGGLWGTVENGNYDNKETITSRDPSPSGASSSSTPSEKSARESKRTKGSDELPLLRIEPTGRDDISFADPSLPAPGAADESDVVNRDGDSSAPAPVWFETAKTVQYWADRGRKVLAEMGIPVVHGIER